MARLLTRSGLLLASVAVLVVAPACGEKKGPPPSAVVRAYFNAYNTHNGKVMCDNFTPELRSWLLRTAGKMAEPSNPPCSVAAIGLIGGFHELDMPIFKHLKVLSAEQQIQDSSAVVDVTARYHFDTEDTTGHDKIYLTRRNGRWLIEKPGAVYYITMSANGPPSSMVDPPIPDKGAGDPAPQPVADFNCGPKLLGDVPNDEENKFRAASSLDITRVAAYANSDGSACIVFSFRSPPLPGTELSLQINEDASVIRIGAGGRFYGLDTLVLGSRAGWKDGKLELLWAVPKGAGKNPPFSFEVQTQSLQTSEPEIKHPFDPQGDAAEGMFEGNFGQ
jgi:uncharacterized protein YchJ